MNQGRGGYHASSLHLAYQPLNFIQPSVGILATETPRLPARRQTAIPEPSDAASKIDQTLSLFRDQQQEIFALKTDVSYALTKPNLLSCA